MLRVGLCRAFHGRGYGYNIHDYIRAFYGYECRIIISSEIPVLLSIESPNHTSRSKVSSFLISVPLAKSTTSSPRRDAFVCSVYFTPAYIHYQKMKWLFPLKSKEDSV